MNIIFALLISLFAGLSTLFGAIFVFLPIKRENINKFITFSLSFSIAIMIGISITDLLPESIVKITNTYNKMALILIIILFLISYLLIKFINRLLTKYENNLYKLGILSMITLIMHNLPEGILTFLSSYSDISLGIRLSLAIAMHNIPEGIAIAIPIYYATGSKLKAITKTVLSGLSEPFGAILAYLFLSKYINHNLIAIILVVVSGLMITLAIEQMLPEALKYHENKSMYFGILLGISVIILNTLL
ncbi:MAG: zinc transporter ZupT [Firmicutes bacterium]|nr:zinc transporter ZupT [Bacillota bacterium]